jgi:hypothetical protein
LALWRGPDYDPYLFKYGDGFGPAYDNWDKDSIQACECDASYFGPDCSLSMCPKGDDPLTINQNYRRIRLRLSTRFGKIHSGDLGLQFQGTKVYIALVGSSSSRCTAELSYRGKFGQVICSYTRTTNKLFFYDLTFVNWPVTPKDNNLYNNDGNPSIYDFYCDTSLTNYAKCDFYDLESENIREYATCSNRGTCNFNTGVCDCLDGFGGPACSNMTNLYFTGSDALPGLEVSVQPSNFSSSVLYLQSLKSAARDFNLISAYASNAEVFAVRGDGHVVVQTLFTPGGQTISGNGLYISTGGMTVNNDPVLIYSEKEGSSALLEITSAYEGVQPNSFCAMTLTSKALNENNHYLLAGIARNNRIRFLLRADGAVFIRNGGLHVTGGTTVGSGGVNVQDGGVTIGGQGIKLVSGGLTVGSAAANFWSSTKVLSGGFQVLNGGVTVAAGGLRLQAGGARVFSGGLDVTGGVSVNGGLAVTEGITIQSSGLVVTGGLTVANTGLVVTSGGLTVSLNAGSGLRVANGGLTIDNSGMMITAGGMTVSSGSATINGDMTVQNDVQVNGDLNIAGTATIQTLSVDGGATVVSSGLNIVTGGLTVNFNGMNIVGDSSIASSLQVTSTMTVLGDVTFGSHTYVTGGLSVTGTGPTPSLIDGGLTVADGMSVANGGIVVTDGISSPDGVMSGGGLTVTSGPFLVGNTGVTVSGTFNALAGLSVNNGLDIGGGATVSSGLVVDSGSFSVTAASLEAAASGMTVGVVVSASSGLTVANGFDVFGGFTVSGGLTVTAGGTDITDLVTLRTGLLVSGGGTVGGGLRVTGGITVGGGATMASGLEVDNGLDVTGGMTVDTGAVIGSGLIVTGGATVSSVLTANSGITADSGSTIGGVLAVTGGATVSGVLTANSGLTVSNGAAIGGGMTVNNGMTIPNGASFSGGLNGVGGITVTTDGVNIANGLTVTDDAQISADMTVMGDVHVTGSIFYGGGGGGSISDQRLKKRIEPIFGALQKVSKLRGVYFHWNITAMEAKGLTLDAREQFQRQVGVLAQDVQDVLPELVRMQSKKPINGTSSMHFNNVNKQDTDSDTSMGAQMETEDESQYLTVDYMYLTPLLIEAIHDLNANRLIMDTDIQQLQEENAMMEQLVTSLELDNEQLEHTIQSLQQDLVKIFNKLRNR